MLRTIHRNLKKSRGFTLVELMIVVAIVGILAALAIYGVRKYMANAKTAEAKNSLGQIAKDASAAFNREKMASTVMAATVSTTVSNLLCAKADASVPDALTKVAGKKYQSAQSEWDVGTASKGWACLKFSMAEPQYYMYGYDQSGTTGQDNDTFTATAKGDLDGDAVASTFTLEGKIQGGAVAISPAVGEDKPEE